MDHKLQEKKMMENARRDELRQREKAHFNTLSALGGKGTTDATVDMDGEHPVVFKLDLEEKKVPGSFPTATTTKKEEPYKTATTSNHKGSETSDKPKMPIKLYEFNADKMFRNKTLEAADAQFKAMQNRKNESVKYVATTVPHPGGHGLLRLVKPLESAEKAPEPKGPAIGGNSSRTATSLIDDEPFGLASRWTSEERDRKKEVRKGLVEDGEEGEWVVV